MRGGPCCPELVFVGPAATNPRPSSDKPLRHIGRTLGARGKLDAIHVIAHGEAGATNLASGTMFSSATDNFFNTDFSKQELTAPSSVLSAENAVFAHEPSDAFPASSLAVTNDYADMAFRRGLVG